MWSRDIRMELIMRKIGFVALAIMAFAILAVLSTHAPTVQAQTPPTPPGVEDGITPPPDLDSAQPGDPVEEEEEGAEGQGDERPEGLPDNVDTAQPGDPVEEEEEGAEGQGDERPEGLPDNVDTAQPGDPVDEGGTGGLTGTAPAPTNLRVISSEHDSVNVRWNSVTDADAYRVEYKKSSATSWVINGYVYDGTSREVTGLDCNTSYSFRVRARGDGNPYSYTYGLPSNTVSRSTDLCLVDAPTGLSVTSSDDDSVSLTWNSVTSAAAYRFEYKKVSSDSWLTHGYVYSGTSRDVTNLACGTSYSFRVRARGNGTSYSYTYSDPSSTVSRTTDQCRAPAPTGLSVTSSDDDSVNLTWNAVTDAGAYKVEYRKSSSSTWLHHGYVYSGTSRTVTDLDCNTSYSFHVKARGDGNPYSLIYGSPSNVVSQTTSVCPSTPTTPTPTDPDPDPPTNLSLSIESGDDDDLDLTFTRSGPPHNYEFELYSSPTENGTFTRVDTEEESTSPANFDDQTRGHWYKARGRNCATSSRTGCGDWSAYSATILLPSPLESPDPAYTWTATLTSGYDSQYSEYGFWGGTSGIGTLSPETFDFDGSTHIVLYIIWDQTGQRVQFRVDRCLKSTDFVSLSIGSSTYNISDAVLSYSDLQCQANGALRQRFNFNNVTTNPLSSGSTYQVTVSLSGPVTNTPAVKVEADTSEPFIGESATLTARTSLAFGTASAHQWQEWSGSAWTNLASATSSSHVATSSSSGVKTFRVSATNASSVTENSLPISIEWRPMSVTVTASPDYPESGDATRRMVTLTATADAPSGVTYQWQKANGSSWTNLGTPSTSVTRSVSRTTRGTEKFRVQLSHSVVPSAEPPPVVHVTWDEFAIVGDLVTALNASTTSDSGYTSAQTSLTTCVNGAVGSSGSSGTSGGASGPTGSRDVAPFPTFTTFQGVLNNYRDTVRTSMETGGTCNSHASTMFSTNERVATTTLAALKLASSTYAGWLDTPQGRVFEENLADPDETRLLAYLGSQVAATSTFAPPLYSPDSPSGQNGTTHTDAELEQRPGLGCLPANVVGADLTLDNKLKVLNCLVFATPHNFWVEGSGTREADALREAIDDSNGRFAWLDSGDWECTFPEAVIRAILQGPVPSCLKHDVAYGGLQKIAGMNIQVADGTELDEAWNPRNKALADYKFRADIARWGCQDQTFAATLSGLCSVPSSWIATVPYFRAVAKFNHKDWPVTTRDIGDFKIRPEFIGCAEPVVSRVTNVSEIIRRDDTLVTVWDWDPGCVETSLNDVSFYIEWEIASHPYRIENAFNSSDCAVNGTRHTCSHDLGHFTGAVTGLTMYVVPRDRQYGGRHYGGEGLTGRRHTQSVGPFEFNLD